MPNWTILSVIQSNSATITSQNRQIKQDSAKARKNEIHREEERRKAQRILWI